MLENINIADKRIIVCDVDGTLADSKAPIDNQMLELLKLLLNHFDIAVISGAQYNQLMKQFASLVQSSANQSGFYMLPTCGSAMYRIRDGAWKQMYCEMLSDQQRSKIVSAIINALDQTGFVQPKKLYGEQIEDRGSQITFSALGQHAPLELKSVWDPDCAKRTPVKQCLERLLPEFRVALGGSTSIDVTQKGIDKAYGIANITKHLGYSKLQMLFFGDMLAPNGNDYPVKTFGVDCVEVSSPADTKRAFSQILEYCGIVEVSK